MMASGELPTKNRAVGLDDAFHRDIQEPALSVLQRFVVPQLKLIRIIRVRNAPVHSGWES